MIFKIEKDWWVSVWIYVTAYQIAWLDLRSSVRVADNADAVAVMIHICTRSLAKILNMSDAPFVIVQRPSCISKTNQIFSSVR